MLSMPQLMANSEGSGVAGNPPGGAAGSKPSGMDVIPVNRGAVATVRKPGGFDTLLESPNDPEVSNELTTPAPK